MRLPHSLLSSQFFTFSSLEEVLEAAAGDVDDQELTEINRLAEMGLPPVTSREILGLLFGLNSGIIWSFESQNKRHYRTFEIKRGRGKSPRIVRAPKVGIKAIQKWLSVHFEQCFQPPDHCFGFVRGRSHLAAAAVHLGAKWTYSADVKDFFLRRLLLLWFQHFLHLDIMSIQRNFL